MKIRITQKDIDDAIAGCEILVYANDTKILRWAVIEMKNGFLVTGKPSVCVDIRNDDSKKGEEVAIANAKENMWELLGYELHQRLNNLTYIERKEAKMMYEQDMGV